MRRRFSGSAAHNAQGIQADKRSRMLPLQGLPLRDARRFSEPRAAVVCDIL